MNLQPSGASGGVRAFVDEHNSPRRRWDAFDETKSGGQFIRRPFQRACETRSLPGQRNWRGAYKCPVIAKIGVRKTLMSMASPEIQKLAEHLLASEAAHEKGCEAGGAVVPIIKELRVLLIRLAGVDGFRSLLSRALALARTQAPGLHHVRVSADGFLEGFEKMEQSEDAVDSERAERVLVFHLLGLLVTFIGQPLTLRLLSIRWPDAVANSAGEAKEETP